MMDSTLAKRLVSEGIVPLSERAKTYLQVLVTNFALVREPRGCRLELNLDDELLSIDNTDRKQVFHTLVRELGSEFREALKQELANFEREPRIMAYRFECPKWPLRYANGGVLPIVQFQDRSYFVLFYRDAFPAGWNLANGGSDDRQEFLEPGRIVRREFGEELLIVDCDNARPMLYLFDPGEENRPSGYQIEAVEAWKQFIPDLDRYTRSAIPLKLIDGPDSVAVKSRTCEQLSSGYFLNITPDDNAIEVDQVALINLNGNVRLLDGEIDRGSLLNRIVGLFEVETTIARVCQTDIFPDRMFRSAQEFSRGEIDRVLDEYLNDTAQRDESSVKSVAAYRDMKHKPFGLCPIARKMIERYCAWREECSRPNVFPQPVSGTQPPDEECQVFISHKSTNIEYARWLFQFLRQQGYRVFFSDETLAQRGESDYAAAINAALDTAQVLVILATSAEDFRSGWVDYEWKSFLNEILSSRKPDGQIFSLLSGVQIAQLPFALRSRQMVPFSPLAPHDAFENLKRFIDPVLAR